MKQIAAMMALCVSVAGLATDARGQTGDNPIPQRIAKGDLRVELQLVAEGFDSPLKLVHQPGKPDRLIVVDQSGFARLIEGGKLSTTPFLDVSKRIVKLNAGFDERGLLGLAFHPGFNDPNSPGHLKLYTYTSEPYDKDATNDFPLEMKVGDTLIPPDHQSVIAEWRVKSADDATVDASTRREVMRFDQPQFNHDGGDIEFGPDGMLYIATGDGGAANDEAPGHAPGGNGQSLETVLGKILRIDPLGKDNARFAVPVDNPFVGKTGLDVIYAYGLRNPFRICFDRQTGKLYTGDIGQEDIEEINVIESGGNYGWKVKEGTFYFVPPTPGKKGDVTTQAPANAPKNMIDPIAQYDHDEGISIIGGHVYRGKAIPAMVGKYVFGEWTMLDKTLPQNQQGNPNGRLLYLDLDTKVIHEFRIGADDRKLGQCVTGFGEDGHGEVYLLTNDKRGPLGGGGKVYRIAAVKQ